MNGKKSKQSDNLENLCPLSRKRLKSTASGVSWKLATVDTSSPTASCVDSLEEMGVGMLESEESSSSAASAIALAVSTSADENSNEAAQTLDPPKFCHHNAYCALDSVRNSTDANPSCLDSYRKLKTTAAPAGVNGNIQHENTEDQSLQRFYCQHKKVAILGVGAGIVPQVSATISPNAYNSNSNSPLAVRSARSPLTIVSSNRQCKTVDNLQQLPETLQQQQSSGFKLSNTQCSPSQPSTSRQAMSRLQQQQKCLLQPRFAPNENFFLYRNRTSLDGDKDHFNTLSDEIILQIFKWLPKKALIRSSYVSSRFNRCANDESLWVRLDLGGRTLRAGAMENILKRGVVIFRLAQAELIHPVFGTHFLQNEKDFTSKLFYLDLSMASVTKPSLKMLLSKCRQLKKLSLEHIPINDDICNEISENKNLEALNLAMCLGLEAWSVRKMMESLKDLSSLNISWTCLSVDAVTSIVTNVTPTLMRLNIAGCRKTMFDSHLASLAKRCPQLLELDLSDCTGLTGNAISIICKFKMIEYLSLSRCYLIPVSAYMELVHSPTLTYLDLFGMLSDSAMEMLEATLPGMGINKFIHSSVARPTVGTRRTSIWGLRTRD